MAARAAASLKVSKMKTVVFDLDGTLADTSGDLLGAANATFAKIGLPAPLGPQDAGLALRGGRAMLRAGLTRLNQPFDEARIAALYPQLLAQYEGALAVHTRLYDGAEAALLVLREKGFALAVCTNKPTYLAEALLTQIGIRPLFGALIGAGSLDVVKPNPAPYLAAVAGVGGTASMMIGDTETDHLTARAAGVPSVLVGFGPGADPVAALAPDAILRHFDDLPELAFAFLGRP